MWKLKCQISPWPCKSWTPIKNTEHCHTNPGALLGILGTWGSYFRVVNLGSKVKLCCQRSVEIKNVINTKLISKLKILKLSQLSSNFLRTLRGHPKINLNSYIHNPHTLKKWWNLRKLNQVFHPVNFIRINSHFTITLKNIPEIDFNKNWKIWAGVPLPPPPNFDYCLHLSSWAPNWSCGQMKIRAWSRSGQATAAKADLAGGESIINCDAKQPN